MKKLAAILISLFAFNGIFGQTIADIHSPVPINPPVLTLCPGQSMQFYAIAANFTSFIWTSSGSGDFDNRYILDPTYYPGNDTGSIIIKLTVTGPAGTVSDSVNVIVKQYISAYCGSGGIINSSQTFAVTNASAPGADSVSWQVYPVESGTLDNYSVINPVFTPNVGFSGGISLSLIAYSTCMTYISSLYIQVLESYIHVNDTTVYSLKNTPVTVIRTITDSDPNAVFTANVITAPTHGILTTPAVSGNQVSVTYTPNLNYTGADPITLSVCDNANPVLCDQANINMNVTQYINTQPFVEDTSISIQINTPTTIYLTISDPDPNSVFSINNNVGNSIHGTVTRTILGNVIKLVYTPNHNYIGNDQFSVYFFDNGTPVLSDHALVNVNVTTTNNNVPPVAVHNIFYTIKNHSITGNVLLNDYDPDGNLNSNSFVLTSSVPGHGTFSYGNNGVFTFNPNTNYTGAVQFYYKVSDLGAPSYNDETYVNIAVENGPIITDTMISSPQNLTFEICREIIGYDPNAIYTLTLYGTPTHGTSTQPVVNGNHLCVTYDPDDGYTGFDFIYMQIISNLTAPSADIASLALSIVPTNNNNPPVVADTSVLSVPNTPVTIYRTITDPNPNSVFTAQICGNPVHGSVSAPVITGDLLSVTYTPVQNYAGTDDFCIRVIDNGYPQLWDDATISVNVSSAITNQPPVISDTTLSIVLNTPISICCTITDPDLNSVFTASICSNPANGFVSPPLVNGNQVCFNYTPNTGYTGSDPFCIQVCDNGSPVLCDAAIITINIANAPNNAPIAVTDNYSTLEDMPLAGNVSGNDSDVDGNLNPNGYTLITNAVKGTLTLNSNGSFTYIPFQNVIGTDTFIYQVCDLGMPVYCDTAIVSIQITPVNDPPIANTDIANTSAGYPVTFDIIGNDTDIDGTLVPSSIDLNSLEAGVQNVFTVAGQGFFEVNPLNGLVTFTPEVGFDGNVTPVVYQVCDNGTPLPVLCSNAGIYVTVFPGPVVNAGNDTTIAITEVYENTSSTAYNYTSLSWITSGIGTFDNITVLHPTYTPGTADLIAGSVILTLTAYNGNGSTSDQMVLSFIPQPDFICSNVSANGYTNNPVYAYLFQETGTGTFEFLNEQTAILEDNFCFDNAPAGNYIFYAEPESPLSDFYIPTYFGNVANWENATIVSPGGGGNIDLLPVTDPGSGGDTISGSISGSGDFYLPASIYANVLVLLYNSSNEPVDWTKTDADGYYSFSSLPHGSYYIKPTITGYSTNSFMVTLSASSPSAIVNFVIEGHLITSIETIDSYISGLFPNPATNELNIIISPAAPKVENYCITDINGRILVSENSLNLFDRKLKINTGNLTDGTYFLRLCHCNGMISNKLFVIIR